MQLTHIFLNATRNVYRYLALDNLASKHLKFAQLLFYRYNHLICPVLFLMHFYNSTPNLTIILTIACGSFCES